MRGPKKFLIFYLKLFYRSLQSMMMKQQIDMGILYAPGGMWLDFPFRYA